MSCSLLLFWIVVAGICGGACKRDAGKANAPERPFTTDEQPPPKLVGIYTLSEVENNGMVTMIPDSHTTSITFYEDGNFSRMSKNGGMVDHADQGSFRIEPGEDGKPQLKLKVIFSDSRNLSEPKEQQHSLAWLPDGSEIKLGGTSGKTAIFRRTVAPKKE